MTKTLAYYNENAAQYSENTVAVAFETQRNILQKHLEKQAHILDLGCGSGRDSLAFLKNGYRVTAVDGSKALCELASVTLGQEVKCLTFDQLDEREAYDAVWACASLLHLPSRELGDIFDKVKVALKPSGYFYASFKYGEFEGERDGRYFTDFTQETFEAFINQMPHFEIIETQATDDVMIGRENLKWLNVVMKKVG
ncbi:MAG: class I SAM-dependent methyltransferase [Turicibacter sp.]